MWRAYPTWRRTCTACLEFKHDLKSGVVEVHRDGPRVGLPMLHAEYRTVPPCGGCPKVASGSPPYQPPGGAAEDRIGYARAYAAAHAVEFDDFFFEVMYLAERAGGRWPEHPPAAVIARAVRVGERQAAELAVARREQEMVDAAASAAVGAAVREMTRRNRG